MRCMSRRNIRPAVAFNVGPVLPSACLSAELLSFDMKLESGI